MKLARLFRSRDQAAIALYGRLVAQARRPEFYTVCGVADTVPGRFEMIALHMFLVLYRLKQEGGRGAALAQNLFDVMFEDMDRNLRELGTGDLAVGKRIKSLAKSLYGRIAAYESGLAPSGGGEGIGGRLEEALARNVFADVSVQAGQLAALADYLRRTVATLAAQDYRDIAAGRPAFGPLPGSSAEVE